MSELDKQVGGSHYKDMAIQPVEYCHRNGLGACESHAIGYLSRWRGKGGIEDLRKARHMIDLLIEMELANEIIKPTEFHRAPATPGEWDELAGAMLDMRNRV